MRVTWILIILLLPGLVSAVPHEQYPSFASTEQRLSPMKSSLFFEDDAIYKTAYYSVNGSEWQLLNLQGAAYEHTGQWLRGNASYPLLLAPLRMSGVHYLLVYSCSWRDGWDCHAATNHSQGFWQLITINNTLVGSAALEEYYSDCSDVLDYQCGNRIICDGVREYGACQEGYDCIDNLCIARDNRTCVEVTCMDDEYCAHGVCLLTVPGNTYFVSLWGNDSNPGTFERPFYRWQKAVTTVQPGDIVYFRGGVWQPATYVEETFGMRISGPGAYNTAKSGTKEAPIRYFNYPGERPILDGKLMLPPNSSFSHGISMGRMKYLHLRGLTVRHIYQYPPKYDHPRPERVYSQAGGVGCAPCANITYENIVVHNIMGRGFEHRNFDNDPEFDNDYSSWINCDAYNLYDYYDNTPGNAADGWKVHGTIGDRYYWEGCRAWSYSDDGYDADGKVHRHFKSCWAMSTLNYENLSDDWGMEGNGYKISAMAAAQFPGYQFGEEHYVKMEQSIAANCGGSGFVNNLFAREAGYESDNGLYRNNFGYQSYSAFVDGVSDRNIRTTNYTNNIAYGSTSFRADGSLEYEVMIYHPSIYPHTHNTWMGTMKDVNESGTWPGWKYNPDYNVTGDDFVSLDYWQLARPRKADGSLPDIEFGHLAPGSELIDGGAVIPGYHCATAGEHPGEDCVVWHGSAPDLGPFEYEG